MSEESQFVWNGNEAALPVNNEVPLHQCVILYIGCRKVTYQQVHTEIVDRTIQYLHERESPARTVLVQIYRHHVIVRTSSNEVCLVFPIDQVAFCLSTPAMSMMMGLIVKGARDRECFIFGVDDLLIPHGAQAHQKYAKRFGLKCPIPISDSCPAFPRSPGRLMHYLNVAMTQYRRVKCVWTTTASAGGSERRTGFESVVNDKQGFEALRNFMIGEKNEENLDFWKECERLKRNWSDVKAQIIYNEFIRVDAPREVNLDWDVRKMLAVSLTPESLIAAQKQIGLLIERGPFPRFLKTSTFQNFM